MANYSADEIAAFNRKDLLNSRMSAVKATSVNFEGKAVDFELFKAFSDEIFDWIRQDQLDAQPMPDVKDTDVLPVPTAEQKKVLDAVYSKYGTEEGRKLVWEEMCKLVLKYSTEVAGLKVATYPTNMDNVENICDWIKEQ